MPVRIDQLPPPATLPDPPRRWFWLTVLLLFVLIGFGLMCLLDSERLQQDPAGFWALAVGGPLLAWSVASFIRVSVFIGEQRAADGWNEAREADLVRRLKQGRRSQQVLTVALYTALRDPEVPSAVQLNALLEGKQGLVLQPSSANGSTVLHSRLPGEVNEAPERLLIRVMTQVLADVRGSLAQFPDDAPLALLLEIDTRLSGKQTNTLWQQAWDQSGIRQSFLPVDGTGLAAVDHWLNQRICDQSLLLVVALQCAPVQPDGTAEAAVGILFGNRLTQNVLPPVAYLHRPEQSRASTTEALSYSLRQALEWVPLQPEAVAQVWRVGIDSQRDASLTKVLTDVSMPNKPNQGLCNFDALLGVAGLASPWLAIAAATQNIQRGVGPQFIFSSDGSGDTELWSSVLTPVPPSSK